MVEDGIKVSIMFSVIGGVIVSTGINCDEVLKEVSRMRIQTQQERQKRIYQLRKHIYAVARRSMAHRPGIAPTEQERKLVLTGMILGGLSIVSAFFPIGGLPIAIVGLIMGLRGRRVGALYKLATWAVALSVIGLVLAVVNIIVWISIYFSAYMWG